MVNLIARWVRREKIPVKSNNLKQYLVEKRKRCKKHLSHTPEAYTKSACGGDCSHPSRPRISQIYVCLVVFPEIDPVYRTGIIHSSERVLIRMCDTVCQ